MFCPGALKGHHDPLWPRPDCIEANEMSPSLTLILRLECGPSELESIKTDPFLNVGKFYFLGAEWDTRHSSAHMCHKFS